MNFDWFPIKPLLTYNSKINGKITIGKQKERLCLYSGGVTQSGGEIRPMWDEVIKKLYTKGYKPKHILVLGVGGGSVIQAIRTHDKSTHILGIELDPVMKQIALEQFAIKENAAQTIHIANAISFLFRKAKKASFDLIIVDLYIGRRNPAASRTKKFLQQLQHVTKQNGIILYNTHYQKNKSTEYALFRKKTDAVFPSVSEVFRYPLNRVLHLSSL